MPVTHDERRVRRNAIADFCREGGTVNAACRKFGVGATLVGTACTIAGVIPGKPKRGAPSKLRLKLIAELVNSARSYAALARKYKLSRQAVQQLAHHCATAGLKVKPRGEAVE